MSNHILGIQLAEELLLDLSPEVPKYQLMVYVDLAEMYIQYEDPQNCIRLCVHALSLPITHTFSHIAPNCMYCSRKDICDCYNLEKVLQACKRGLLLQNLPLHSTTKLYYTQGTLQYQLGKRSAARHSWNAIQFQGFSPSSTEGSRAVSRIYTIGS